MGASKTKIRLTRRMKSLSSIDLIASLTASPIFPPVLLNSSAAALSRGFSRIEDVSYGRERERGGRKNASAIDSEGKKER